MHLLLMLSHPFSIFKDDLAEMNTALVKKQCNNCFSFYHFMCFMFIPDVIYLCKNN
jgi:hypothetical protein